MPINFNQTPYYDDFSEDDLLYKLLFRPGRAVQARELTQIQSLLQSQVSRLGNHIFKDGSLVTGGETSYDKTHTKWLAVKSTDAHDRPVLIRGITPGLFIRRSAQADQIGPNPLVYGKITEVIPAENGEPDTLYFQWEDGEPTDGRTGFGSNENLIIYDEIRQTPKFTVTTLEKDSSDNAIHYGTASKIAVRPGIYYWKGKFVRSLGGSIILGKYTKNTTFRIGFRVSEEINTQNPKSLDPASGSSNYAAPGADRYEVKLYLEKYGAGVQLDESILENFIEVARVVDGELITTPQDQTIYNILGDRLAQRTYEESGNYLVKPYNIIIKNKTTQDNPKLVAKMSDGISYVKGYRRTLNKQNVIEVDKGRDVLTKSLEMSPWYGDNRVIIYDRADNTLTNHKEKANGIFTVGSGAGTHTSNVWYGERGAAVSLHCVPHDQVKDYSLTDQWKWNSTLVGTARPIQMTFAKDATDRSDAAGRPGMSYSLWLGDFKSSPITNTVSVSNILNSVSAYGNTLFGVFHFSSATHGITSNDEISVTGQSNWDTFTGANVASANSTAVLVSGDYSGYSASDSNALTLRRTTGETTGLNTVVLDEYTSSAWNDSYVGATIRVNNGTNWSEPRTIIGFVGTNGAAEALWNSKYDPDSRWATGVGPAPGRRATVLLDGDLDIAPVYGYTYELTLTSKQARSVVHNYNKSSTGAEQYPALLSQMWNIDPISGVIGGDAAKLSDDFYGGRIDGDCLYNRYAGSVGIEDALLWTTEKTATKSVLTHGNLDSGLTSNTHLYYTEYVVSKGSGAFVLPSDSEYDFFSGHPIPYPYSEAAGSVTVSDSNKIKANYILVNRDTGATLTNDITSVAVTTSSRTTTITGPTFSAGVEYALLLPVRAKYAEPAYKKLVTGNSDNSITLPSTGDLTDFSRGQILIDSAAYGTTEGSVVSLKKPDVFKLKKVVHNVNNGDANTDLANTQLDITSRFILDSGQREMFYDNGSIRLASADAPTGNLIVCFDYFQRMTGPKSDTGREENLDSPSYFAVDSYQYTTDLVFDEMSPAGASTFAAGDLVTGNGGATGYVLDFANTSGSGAYAKVRLQDVQGTFEVGNWVSRGSSAGKIKSITTADLKYSEIPYYESPEEEIYSLRNMIDMRAYVSTSDRVSDTISNSIMPLIPINHSTWRRGLGRFKHVERKDLPGVPTIDPSTGSARQFLKNDLKSSHFAGRIDKLVLTDSGKYSIVAGAASDAPVPPREKSDGTEFTIATIHIPPYTLEPTHVQVKPNIAVRHTMKDIGRLAKRVENLEYYVSLNALETDALDLSIKFADGTPRFKNGIVVDDFQGHSVRAIAGGVWQDHKASTGKGILEPAQETYSAGTYNRGAFELEFIDSSVSGSDTARIIGHRASRGEPTHAMIAYDTEEFISQRAATSLESVNPFDLQDFTGELTLIPDTDHWVDTGKVPEYNAIIAGDKDNPIAQISDFVIRTGITGRPGGRLIGGGFREIPMTPAKIAQQLQNISGLWETISGVSIGDDITGTAEVRTLNEDGGFDVETRARNIKLGNISVQKYTALADIDAAIARAASIDGMVKSIEILPYVRSRDVIIHATGMKPSWSAGLFFEGVGLEYLFSRANEVYIRRDVGQNSDGTPTGGLFQPEIDGTPERIQLTGLGGHTANALLIAVRDTEFFNTTTSEQNMKVGYIVPEFTDVDNGKVDWATYKDGYYASGWSNADIASYGFNGTHANRKITGRRTSAESFLVTESGASVKHLYNGHYTGTARNLDSGNTTHIVLSPEANRYIAANFGSTALNPGAATPRAAVIKIVHGKGQGLECIANTFAIDTEDNCPVVELRSASDGTFSLDKSWGGGPGVDSTSVYSIRMLRRDPNVSRNISQIGWNVQQTNRFGDKVGLMHIPAAYTRAEWTAGSKLIELKDRGFNAEHLIKNYASAYYNSGGQRQIMWDDQTLTKLQGIRNALSVFRINDEPGATIPASDDTGSGILGVVSAVTIANGTYTVTSTQPYVPGPAEVGEVVDTTPNELSDITDLIGLWQTEGFNIILDFGILI